MIQVAVATKHKSSRQPVQWLGSLQQHASKKKLKVEDRLLKRNYPETEHTETPLHPVDTSESICDRFCFFQIQKRTTRLQRTCMHLQLRKEKKRRLSLFVVHKILTRIAREDRIEKKQVKKKQTPFSNSSLKCDTIEKLDCTVPALACSVLRLIEVFFAALPAGQCRRQRGLWEGDTLALTCPRVNQTL